MPSYVTAMESSGAHPPTSNSQPYSDTSVKTYRYLRIAMVALLVGLGVAVFYQTGSQGWHLLSSVSAYYYTAAQTIFVGALIGLGTCMIALKGTTDLEDLLLNLGGAFAAVVAIVPTSRGSDYRTAIRACNQVVTQGAAAKDLDCPTVRALEAATKANVQNNMVALLAVGMLGLLAALLFFALRDRKMLDQGDVRAKKFWRGFGAMLAVFVVGAIAFVAKVDWFIDNAHYMAALCLFICILGVAVVNAGRQRQERQEQPDLRNTASDGQKVQVSEALKNHRYTWVALAMLLVAGVGIGLWISKVITLFWLEIAVALLFAVFWMVQTIEQLGDDPGW